MAHPGTSLASEKIINPTRSVSSTSVKISRGKPRRQDADVAAQWISDRQRHQAIRNSQRAHHFSSISTGLLTWIPGMFGDPSELDPLLYCPLQRAFMDVVSPPSSRSRIGRNVLRREHVLPSPLVLRVRILSLKRIRKLNFSVTALGKDPVQRLRPLQMFREIGNHRFG